MAKLYAQDYKITINGTDLSSSITSVELMVEADDLETTAFGSNWRTRIAGLRQGSVKLDFFADYGASAVEATLYPLLGTVATVVMLPTSGTASSTNPQYAATVLVTEHVPLTGAIGDIATFSVTWPTTGTVTKTP